MTASLKVKPSDLTRIAARNGGTFPLMRIERIISGEELPAAGHGSSQMPVWGPIFSHVERDQDLGRVHIDNLARYLRDLQINSSPSQSVPDSPACQLHIIDLGRRPIMANIPVHKVESDKVETAPTSRPCKTR